MESPFYEEVIKRWLEEGKQRGLEQGIERGAREATIENTLTVVTERFPFADIVALKSRLEGISDIGGNHARISVLRTRHATRY